MGKVENNTSYISRFHTMKEESAASEVNSSATHKSAFEPMSWQKLLLKATGLSLLFVIILLAVTAAGIGIFAYSKLNEFLSVSGLSFSEAKQLVQQGINQQPQKTDNKTVILILGIDTVANKNAAPPLTDTMLLASIDYQSGIITLLSLPRDLWSEEYKTKINALYYYGQERYPNEPERFTKEVVSEITGVPINYTVVFSLNSIGEIVGILDGIDVDVPTSFVDNEFPREDVDVTTTSDTAVLYETVEFSAGTEHMTAERVKKYIRSRHSEGDTGTDLDRSARQQLVIEAIIKQITSRSVLTNPTTLAHLYTWYDKQLAQYIPTGDGISIAYSLYPQKNQLKLMSTSIPIKPENPDGVIEHLPPVKTDNQWTYSIVDIDKFKTVVKGALLNK